MINQEELELRNALAHHGILGMKWGIRRYQDASGKYTSAGKKRYIKDKTSGLQKDIDSFKPFKNGIKDKNGRQILTKEDVESSIAGLEAVKSKVEAKLSQKWDTSVKKFADREARNMSRAKQLAKDFGDKYVVVQNKDGTITVKDGTDTWNIK